MNAATTPRGSVGSSLQSGKPDRELLTISIDPPLWGAALSARRDVEYKGYAATSREAILAILGAVADTDASGAHLLMNRDESRIGLSLQCPNGGRHRLFLRPVGDAGGFLVATYCSCGAGRKHEAHALADLCDLGGLAFLIDIPRFSVLTLVSAGDLDLFTWPDDEEAPRGKYDQ